MSSSSCWSCMNNAGVSDFEKIHSCTGNGLIPVTKYISKSSGLTVVHADIGGPIVSGYICVPTRAQDDDGLPHTLEHLVFLGSVNYPYPGVLDRLSNKCFASGTNAWTDVDHTCFSLSTAGNDGFCQLLPVYLDHIFNPLLTDAAFKTEVYHVGGRGNDGGVVYSEILALENTSYSRATEALYKQLYPKNSGYRWNVGGSLQNLRESCSNEKVRAFHKKFYHPGNTCLVICGKVDIKRVFRSMYPVTSKKVAGNDNLQLAKPWLTEENKVIPDVASPVEKTVYFPSPDLDSGCLVTVGLLGPSVISDDLRDTYAVILLFKYMTKTQCAPLQQDLVERDKGFLATSLDFNAVEYSRTAFTFELDSVAASDKVKVVAQLRKSLQAQLKKIDLVRMHAIIQSSMQAELSLMENSPHSVISEAVIRDFLYGDNDPSKFENRLNRVSVLKSLLQEKEPFWTQLLQDKILAPNWVTIFAEPSKDLIKKLADEDDLRISQRRERLGESGLANLMKELDEAIIHNSRPIPGKIMKKVKVPSMKHIQYHQLNRIENPPWVPKADFPATLCLDDISTNFVYAGVLIDTSKLDDEFRQFLPLFKEMLLASPISGSPNATGSHCDLIPCEEVCAARDKTLQACELDIGLEVDYRGEGNSKFSCGSYSHILSFGLQMDLDKVGEGMLWIKKILWDACWTKECIRTTMNKMIAEVYHVKSDASRMCQTILKHLIYKANSNVINSSLITQLKLLQQLDMDDVNQLKKSEKMIKTAFESIFRVVRNPNNISLHIAANVDKLNCKLEELPCRNLGTLLKSCFPFEESSVTLKREREFANIPDTEWMIPMAEMVQKNRSSLKSNPRESHVILGLNMIDSSYMAMVTKGPDSYTDFDLPALLTTLQYFSQQEGPLFRKIRGEGYAYSYNVVTKINEGLIYFHLYQCADLVGAYTACLTILTDHLTNSPEMWSEHLLASARSSLIFECLETEKTPLSLAANSCLDYYRNISGTFIQDLIAKIAKVKLKDVKNMTKKYLDAMFHSARNNYATVVVCPYEECEIISKGLEKRGRQMRIVQSLEELQF